MPKARLTAEAVRKVSRPKSGRTEYWDTDLTGFHLRVTDKGVKSFAFMTRLHGRQIRVTIGPAEMDVADARQKARDIRDMARRGEDPRRTSENAHTVERAVDLFVERYLKAKGRRTWRETELTFKRHVIPTWGKRPLDSITSKDVVSLLDGIMDRGTPIAANRTLAAIRKMFRWATGRRMIPASPAEGIEPPGEERDRDRVLSPDEIKALWVAWDEMGSPFGPFQKMLLTTMQRRSEVAAMRWRDISSRKLTNGVTEEITIWTLPREMTKADRAHEVPLSALALEILEAMPKRGEYVFTTHEKGEKPISGFSKCKKRTDTLSKVFGWRIHDLRRTGATELADLGVSPFNISRVLNHARSDVTGRYDRYSYIKEKRHALDTWAVRIEEIVSGKKAADNVVDLTDARA
jgi:integrase